MEGEEIEEIEEGEEGEEEEEEEEATSFQILSVHAVQIKWPQLVIRIWPSGSISQQTGQLSFLNKSSEIA